MASAFEPKLLYILRKEYSWRTFRADVLAGIIVAIVALPLAIAFAIASGVKPEQGLYTAVIAGFFVAMLGGSRVQVSGPTGAFVVIVYGIVQEFGYEGLALATVMAGLMLIAMGLAGMGMLLRFIPYPLTVGFTSGIAVIILTSQIADFFGLRIGALPADFVKKWAVLIDNFHSIDLYACLIGASSLFILFAWPKLFPRLPGSLVAIIASTLAAHYVGLPIETIGSRFGAVPQTLPAPHLLTVNWELLQKLFPAAVTISFLGAIESLLSATVADGMIGTRHRSNVELVAQGIGNILSPIFGGIPATGAIARTAANIKFGGTTPVSAMVHALTLLAIMFFFGSYAALIPMPTLAAILIFVAYNMSEWRTFAQMFRAPRGDVLILLITFFLTVFVDLTVAIKVGVILAAFLFVRKMETVTEIDHVTLKLHESEEYAETGTAQAREVPAGVEIFEIFGPLFFGVIERFQAAMKRVEKAPKVLILRMRHVSTIDASGLRALHDFQIKVSRQGSFLLLSGVRPVVREAMKKSGLLDHFGAQNVLESIDKALHRARKLLSEE